MSEIFLSKSLVHLTPRYFSLIPFLSTTMACTIFGKIYFPLDQYNDLVSDNPSNLVKSVYIHELVHVTRQNEQGSLLWNIKYLCNKKFRLQEELAAIQEQMKFLKSVNEVYDIERKAKQFAGSDYLWVCSYQEGKSILQNLWVNARID